MKKHIKIITILFEGKNLMLLPEEERVLIIKAYFYGLTERQLAKDYGISQVAIHKRKNRILAKLKKFLEN